ncbi:MAG: hypothetical protein HETSPECPRED_010390 [Heterodermia speciosa]|uniref:CipC-like antibiotic response protein n=1 Tax=Heterodermia speciosa TaxID=116794 RepID=A0A8H3G4W0_9LECA|nr:MAG: hypothetical protein HETSPECPRED_010390 [Heterodermia speciosa]
MGLFDWGQAQDAHQEVYQQNGGYDEPNEAKFSHELVAGAAAFAGMKKFEDHQREKGEPVNHAFAKELLAGFAGGEVDKLAETKGMDLYDKERAHHQAKENASQLYDQQYGNQDQYDPNNTEYPQQFQNSGRGNQGGYGGNNY